MKSHPIAYIDDAQIVNKRVLVRVDFNVTLADGFTISDDARIRQSLPTLNRLRKYKNKLILMSHLDRPKKRDPRYSLGIVSKHLQKLIPSSRVVLVDDFLSEEGRELLSKQTPREIMVLENTRFYEGEEKNDPTFAKSLSDLADVFVNDAFGSSHRLHASVVGVPRFLPSFGGLLLKKEIKTIRAILQHPKRPFVGIIGGAKIATKISVIKKLIDMVDYLLVGGVIGNTFLQGYGRFIGRSLYEQQEVANTEQLLLAAQERGTHVVLPEDVVVAREEVRMGTTKYIATIDHHDEILDIGPKTISYFRSIIGKARTILWNGPLGYFEDPLYRKGTDAIYDAIVDNKHAKSLVGGGDTIAAISKEEHLNRITHISTGGGAMLEFIEKGTLPGIDALRGRGHL